MTTRRMDKQAARADGPSHAESARTIVASAGQASLATMAADMPGYPFVSVVRYALDAAGRPILALSTLAEHTTNLAKDVHASLMALEESTKRDPLAAGRVTLVGGCHRLDGDEHKAARDVFLAAHPDAFYIDFADFSLFRLDVEAVRYVGGFGRMSWVAPEDYAVTEADPIATDAADIIEHVNADHRDTMLLWSSALAGVTATDATLVGVDRHGFDMAVTTPDGPRAVRIPFDKQVGTPEEVRVEMIRLARAARGA